MPKAASLFSISSLRNTHSTATQVTAQGLVRLQDSPRASSLSAPHPKGNHWSDSCHHRGRGADRQRAENPVSEGTVTEAGPLQLSTPCEDPLPHQGLGANQLSSPLARPTSCTASGPPQRNNRRVGISIGILWAARGAECTRPQAHPKDLGLRCRGHARWACCAELALARAPSPLSSRVSLSSSAPFSFHSPPTDRCSRKDAAPGASGRRPAAEAGLSQQASGRQGTAHGHRPVFSRPTLHSWAQPGGCPRGGPRRVGPAAATARPPLLEALSPASAVLWRPALQSTLFPWPRPSTHAELHTRSHCHTHSELLRNIYL